MPHTMRTSLKCLNNMTYRVISENKAMNRQPAAKEPAEMKSFAYWKSQVKEFAGEVPSGLVLAMISECFRRDTGSKKPDEKVKMYRQHDA